MAAKLKIQYQVLSLQKEPPRVVGTFNTEAEAIQRIEKTPADIMGSVMFTIRKIWVSE